MVRLVGSSEKGIPSIVKIPTTPAKLSCLPVTETLLAVRSLQNCIVRKLTKPRLSTNF